jgi:hypothetical protein
MEQPEERILHHSNIMKQMVNPHTTLNPIAETEVASDISFTFSQSLDPDTDFEGMYYDMVFFRLPGRLTQQVREIIERTWEGLQVTGHFCVYAKQEDGTDLEAVLGPRTSQVYIRDYEEMIFCWVK